ncbi:MAG: 4-(cytidine 5'-diphospho)-2-C-methyl-D-erythritol kinase [Planctomycetota bacterium]
MPTLQPLRTPAKLNWTLEVLGRRPDGFHILHSWFVAAALYDDLLAVPSDAPSSLKVTGPCAAGIPEDERNLILKAEQLWRAAGGEAPQLQWSLVKRIPHAAGLGGGSGNAAAALLWLEHHATRSPDAALEALALQIGSDVPYFLMPQNACLLGGQGETLLAATETPESWVVLAIPSFAVPTADVFRALEAPAWHADSPQPSASDATAFPAQPGPNHLLPAARLAAPELTAFESALQEVAPFHLSGSGGTFFHAAKTQEAALEIAARVSETCQHVEVVPLLTGPVLSRDPLV